VRRGIEERNMAMPIRDLAKTENGSENMSNARFETRYPISLTENAKEDIMAVRRDMTAAQH
jgi:hypothetical protein